MNMYTVNREVQLLCACLCVCMRVYVCMCARVYACVRMYMSVYSCVCVCMNDVLNANDIHHMCTLYKMLWNN